MSCYLCSFEEACEPYHSVGSAHFTGLLNGFVMAFAHAKGFVSLREMFCSEHRKDVVMLINRISANGNVSKDVVRTLNEAFRLCHEELN